MKEILIARVIEHPDRFPSLVQAEALLCRRNLCQGQAGAERKNKTYKEKQVRILLTPLHPLSHVMFD